MGPAPNEGGGGGGAVGGGGAGTAGGDVVVGVVGVVACLTGLEPGVEPPTETTNT